MKKSRRSSISYRIAIIYFMLVFIAMAIMSVFLLDRIEKYQYSTLGSNIDKVITESNITETLGMYDDLEEQSSVIQHMFDDSWTSGFTQEISIVSRGLDVVASTNRSLLGRSAAEVFDSDIIVNALISGLKTESVGSSGEIPVKNFCYVIDPAEGGTATGVVYVRADLSSIETFMARSRMICVRAIALALLVTVFLSFLLARSITEPINDVTETVVRMSEGDFDIEVPVKSDDEIGRLAEMFNILREKLDETITEINGEKNKLGTILQYMADGLIATDLEGRIMHVNPAARRMLRLGRDSELEGESYDDIFGKLSDELSLANITEHSAEGGGEAVFSFGEDSVYAVRFDRFKDETGGDIGIIIIMQDITERQKLEDMQTDFVANVSHELKTPLTNIKSYTETLLDGAIDDRETAMNFLQIVDKEADRMNRLVKDLLQLSRLDHKQEPMNMKESNIVVLVNMAIMKVELTAKQKGLTINTLYDIESDVRAMLDRDRMEQVIMNILSNAIKYTNEGGHIDVDITEKDYEVRVSVQDTGIGIPQSSLPRIFERFYRVDKARSRAMGGTGLGLAITRQIVDEHKGRIEAESEEGKGTKITVVLPSPIRKGIKGIE